MPIGSSYNGNALDAVANAAIASGDPVIVGATKGFANATVSANGSLSVATTGVFRAAVAGTLAVGALVYVASGTVVSGKAVVVTLTATEGTGGKAVFGRITALAQDTGYALVAPIQGNGKGAA